MSRCVVLLLCFLVCSGLAEVMADSRLATVRRVIDGDTIELDSGRRPCRTCKPEDEDT